VRANFNEEGFLINTVGAEGADCLSGVGYPANAA